MNIFHLQEKKFKKKGELLNLDLQWKNTPYAKIRVSLAACDQELTFLDHPLLPPIDQEWLILSLPPIEREWFILSPVQILGVLVAYLMIY